MAEAVVVEAIKEERDKKKKTRRIKKTCIKVVKFFLSTAGLGVLNGLFLALGAYIFSHLEQTNELENCKSKALEYYDAENATIILLMDMAQRMDGIGAMSNQEKQGVIDEFQGYLESFALSVLSTGYDVGVVCDDKGTPGNDYEWSFQNSLLFALTIATTIGQYEITFSFLFNHNQRTCLYTSFPSLMSAKYIVVSPCSCLL